MNLYELTDSNGIQYRDTVAYYIPMHQAIDKQTKLHKPLTRVTFGAVRGPRGLEVPAV